MKRGILILGFLLLFPLHSWADPSSPMKWLQNEPLTLFDWGMWRANKDLEVWSSLLLEDKYPAISNSAYYDYAKNSIILTLTFLPIKDFTIENCRKEIKRFHQGLTTVKFIPNREEATYAKVEKWFSHEGFQKLNRPKDLGKSIADLITLDFFIIQQRNPSKTFTCSMPFVGGDISVTRREPKATK